jgi:hypothetical protein
MSKSTVGAAPDAQQAIEWGEYVANKMSEGGLEFNEADERLMRTLINVARRSSGAAHAELIAEVRQWTETSCNKCDYDEAEGTLLDHCDDCCHRIVTECYRIAHSSALESSPEPTERLRQLVKQWEALRDVNLDKHDNFVSTQAEGRFDALDSCIDDLQMLIRHPSADSTEPKHDQKTSC